MADIPKNTELVYVSFSSDINPNTTEGLINAMVVCANALVQNVYLVMSTTGGSVIHGFNLYNVLKGMPFELSIHNAGSINSIGNVVFLAGTHRYATANATFMFHGVGFDAPPNQRLEEKFLREKLASITSDHNRIADTISKHTNLNKREIAKFFRETQTKDANFALNRGIIEEIRDVQLKRSCPIISLSFKR
jgi:ATP-dependent protease ClpP protease subunit